MSFFRSAGGAETDLVMENYGKVFAIECKASQSPGLSKGNYSALDDINPDYTFVAAPVKTGWSLQRNIEVVNLSGLKEKMDDQL